MQTLHRAESLFDTLQYLESTVRLPPPPNYALQQFAIQHQFRQNYVCLAGLVQMRICSPLLREMVSGALLIWNWRR